MRHSPVYTSTMVSRPGGVFDGHAAPDVYTGHCDLGAAPMWQVLRFLRQRRTAHDRHGCSPR